MTQVRGETPQVSPTLNTVTEPSEAGLTSVQGWGYGYLRPCHLSRAQRSRIFSRHKIGVLRSTQIELGSKRMLKALNTNQGLLREK